MFRGSATPFTTDRASLFDTQPAAWGLTAAGGACCLADPACAPRLSFSTYQKGESTSMNKQELIATVADTSGLGKGDAVKAVEAVFDAISASLKKGDEVRLVGFGTFSVSKRKASTGRNPRTGEEMTIKASNQPKFKAGKGLKDSVN
jgi:DNA-binding protein HU-beta